MNQDDDNTYFTSEEVDKIKDMIKEMQDDYESEINKKIEGNSEDQQQIRYLKIELRYVKDELSKLNSKVNSMTKNSWIKQCFFTVKKVTKKHPNTTKFLLSSDGIGKIPIVGPVVLGTYAIKKDIDEME